MSKKKYCTDILFTRSSFMIGAGSVFNLAGNYFEFNYSGSGDDADSLAIENDWGVVGDDLRKTISENPSEMYNA